MIKDHDFCAPFAARKAACVLERSTPIENARKSLKKKSRTGSTSVRLFLRALAKIAQAGRKLGSRLGLFLCPPPHPTQPPRP